MALEWQETKPPPQAKDDDDDDDRGRGDGQETEPQATKKDKRSVLRTKDLGYVCYCQWENCVLYRTALSGTELGGRCLRLHLVQDYNPNPQSEDDRKRQKRRSLVLSCMGYDAKKTCRVPFNVAPHHFTLEALRLFRSDRYAKFQPMELNDYRKYTHSGTTLKGAGIRLENGTMVYYHVPNVPEQEVQLAVEATKKAPNSSKKEDKLAAEATKKAPDVSEQEDKWVGEAAKKPVVADGFTSISLWKKALGYACQCPWKQCHSFRLALVGTELGGQCFQLNLMQEYTPRSTSPDELRRQKRRSAVLSALGISSIQQKHNIRKPFVVAPHHYNLETLRLIRSDRLANCRPMKRKDYLKYAYNRVADTYASFQLKDGTTAYFHVPNVPLHVVEQHVQGLAHATATTTTATTTKEAGHSTTTAYAQEAKYSTTTTTNGPWNDSSHSDAASHRKKPSSSSSSEPSSGKNNGDVSIIDVQTSSYQSQPLGDPVSRENLFSDAAERSGVANELLPEKGYGTFKSRCSCDWGRDCISLRTDLVGTELGGNCFEINLTPFHIPKPHDEVGRKVQKRRSLILENFGIDTRKTGKTRVYVAPHHFPLEALRLFRADRLAISRPIALDLYMNYIHGGIIDPATAFQLDGGETVYFHVPNVPKAYLEKEAHRIREAKTLTTATPTDEQQGAWQLMGGQLAVPQDGQSPNEEDPGTTRTKRPRRTIMSEPNPEDDEAQPMKRRRKTLMFESVAEQDIAARERTLHDIARKRCTCSWDQCPFFRRAFVGTELGGPCLEFRGPLPHKTGTFTGEKKRKRFEIYSDVLGVSDDRKEKKLRLYVAPHHFSVKALRQFRSDRSAFSCTLPMNVMREFAHNGEVDPVAAFRLSNGEVTYFHLPNVPLPYLQHEAEKIMKEEEQPSDGAPLAAATREPSEAAQDEEFSSTNFHPGGESTRDCHSPALTSVTGSALPEPPRYKYGGEDNIYDWCLKEEIRLHLDATWNAYSQLVHIALT